MRIWFVHVMRRTGTMTIHTCGSVVAARNLVISICAREDFVPDIPQVRTFGPDDRPLSEAWQHAPPQSYFLINVPLGRANAKADANRRYPFPKPSRQKERLRR